MSGAWIPTDDVLDGLARTSTPPAVKPDRAEHVRTCLLAAQPSVRRLQPGRSRSLIIGGSFAISAVAALVIWFFVRNPSPASPMEWRANVVALTSATFERVHDWPDYVVRLEDGRVSARVAALRGDERFRVQTRNAEIEVRGSQFIIEASHAQLTSILVERGSVELRQEGSPPITIGAGDSWPPIQATHKRREAPPPDPRQSPVECPRCATAQREDSRRSRSAARQGDRDGRRSSMMEHVIGRILMRRIGAVASGRREPVVDMSVRSDQDLRSKLRVTE